MPGQLGHGIERVFVIDHDDLVANTAIKRLGNKAGSNALHFVWPWRAALQHRSLGLNGDAVYPGQLFLHESGHTGKCASGTYAEDHSIELALHLLKDFNSRRVMMN